MQECPSLSSKIEIFPVMDSYAPMHEYVVPKYK